uniref:Uncharacterized protein n=1 Tax=Arundo donax TaxID=35708 RepID=A0A0A8YGZ1_ARUDO
MVNLSTNRDTPLPNMFKGSAVLLCRISYHPLQDTSPVDKNDPKQTF